MIGWASHWTGPDEGFDWPLYILMAAPYLLFGAFAWIVYRLYHRRPRE